MEAEEMQLTDDAASFPGEPGEVARGGRGLSQEHVLVLGLGALLMVAGIRSRGLVWRALLTAAGTALVSRAASGTGGVAKVARVVKRLG